MALLACGVLARNRDSATRCCRCASATRGQLFFVVLFVLTGASLDFGAAGQAAARCAAFIVARFLGKAAAILTFGRLSGLRAGGAGLLSLALLPMSGLAVVMVRDTAALYPGLRHASSRRWCCPRWRCSSWSARSPRSSRCAARARRGSAEAAR